jgi:hypothetical protein
MIVCGHGEKDELHLLPNKQYVITLVQRSAKTQENYPLSTLTVQRETGVGNLS